MMIPGQWEPRQSSAVNAAGGAVNAPAVVPAVPVVPMVRRDPDPPIQRRRETATWLEVTIVTIALLAVMFLAMWASRYDSRLTRWHDPSQDVASPVQHVVSA